MIDPQLTGWQPVRTVPENGDEFFCLLNDGRIRVGSLGNDLGGSIRRDPGMVAWHQKKQWYERGAKTEANPPVPSEALLAEITAR